MEFIVTYSLLISAQDLASQLGNPDLIIFDVRHELQNPAAGRTAYALSHIPGAFFLHLDDDLSAKKTGLNGRHPLPDREQFAEQLATLGVNRRSQVVVYDAAGGMIAARLWWMLRWVGHASVAVLDGGWQAWAEENAVTSAMPNVLPRGDLRIGSALTRQVDAAHVLANMHSGHELVIDARGADRFRGENETLDPVGGHIPGARNRCFRDNLDAQNKFRSAGELKQAFKEVLGNYLPEQIIAQCGSGVSACHNLLALEIASLSGAALYPGSWSEWCSDPARPISQGGN